MFFVIELIIFKEYILDISPFSDLQFVKYFRYFVSDLFTLLIIFLTIENHLGLIYSHLFIFACVACTSGVILKCVCADYCHRTLSLRILSLQAHIYVFILLR